jgi:PST family polysaccharide transporter
MFGMIAGRQLLSMAATMILARLLSVTDYGIVGMVLTLTAFFQVFSDIGLNWAIVQQKNLSRAQVDNLFWINAGAGALLWLLCAAAGPFMNRFYGRGELAGIAIVLGSGFLIGSLTVQPTALLRRRMQLKANSLIELLAAAVGACLGVGSALAGFGYWALVVNSLASQVTLVLALFAYTGYWPGPPRRHQGTRQMLVFGGYLAAYGLVNYFARNLDNVLVGRVWGAEQLAYYTRAYFLMSLPAYLAAGSLMAVMVPAMSAVSEDRVSMAAGYRKVVAAIGVITFPLVIGLAVTAPEAIRLVYGAKWAPVAPLLVWLSIAGLFQPVHNTMGWLYVAVGASRKMFLWGAFASACLSAGFWVGVRWRAEGVAISYAIVMTILTVPALYFAHQAARIRLLDTLRPLAGPLRASLTMALVVAGAGIVIERVRVEWSTALSIKVLLGTAVYVGLCRRQVQALLPILEATLRSARGLP